MVGWGFAFGRGFVILLWSILWAIVAGIIAVMITGGSFLALASNPTTIISNPLGVLAALATVFLAVFFGVFIAIIGLYASIVKVTVDGTINQLEKKGLLGSGSYSPSSGSYSASSMGPLGAQPTLTVVPAQRLCQNCGRIVPTGSLKCVNCGASVA